MSVGYDHRNLRNKTQSLASVSSHNHNGTTSQSYLQAATELKSVSVKQISTLAYTVCKRLVELIKNASEPLTSSHNTAANDRTQ